ncbi:MAG: asparagine synthase (glutamine-hydrolyzing) [Glaciecola sp.]
MCGIAGFLTQNNQSFNTQSLIDMGNAIAHRGPDAHGEYLDETVGLCHRRLSILDLSPAGNQPMFSDDENIVIVFNGEIYNFLDLKQDLEAEGVRFKSGTDTEVIIRLYEKYGVECLPFLNGMFAFALWDKRAQKLFIARDRLGKKPLYYYKHNGQFSFASEIKALLALPNINKDIRLDAVHDFFAYQYIPDPKSIFTHVHKLPPAHYMTIVNGDIDIQEYWRLSFANNHENAKTEQEQQNAISHVRELIKQTTKRRMISDVPLGAFLSGGVDSSGVVATMAGLSKKAIKTCTIAFDNKKFNEAEFAKSVAQQYQTEHHEFLVHQNVADTLHTIVGYFDEPFADPSLVPTYFVSELARKEVTVAIAGDGGDEVFGGYEKYHTDFVENRLRSKFPKVIREQIFPVLASLCGKININACQRAKNLLNSLSLSPEMGFYVTNSFMSDEQWKSLARPEVKQVLGDYHPSSYTLQHYHQADGPDHFSKVLYTDMKTYLTGGILVKVDRMSMAHSLEVRAPILDTQVIEYAASLPTHMKYNNKEKKYALKEAFKPYLNDDILYRKKMGFSVPLAQWLRTEIKDIAEQYLISDCQGLIQYFDTAQVQKLWQEHQHNKRDHSTILWSMLMFEMWWQRFMTT